MHEDLIDIFNTAKLLNRPATVAVDAHSGLAGIAFWINGYYKIPQEKAIDKRHPIVAKMKELVDAEYAEGRNTVMGDFELDEMLRALDPEAHLIFMHHTLAKNAAKPAL